MVRCLILLCASVGVLSGCMFAGAAPGATSADGAIQVSGAWVRPMLGPAGADHSTHANATTSVPAESGMGTQPTSDATSGMAGMVDSSVASTAYMTIRNSGSSADRLLKAQTDAASTVEIHDNKDTAGVMSMSQVQALDIPANSSVELKPIGLHMMLIGLKRDLNSGDTVALTLSFEKAGTVQVQAAVRDQ